MKNTTSAYGYPKEYKVKSIQEQIELLRDFFPNLPFSSDGKLVNSPLPVGAEGYFAIPRWQILSSTYGEAVKKVLATITAQRNGKFYNWREGQLGYKHLRQMVRTAKMFCKIGDTQKDNNILILPAQFGLRYRGCSVSRARKAMSDSEFGLGTFAVGIMLLTHPERLMSYEDLWIDCAGDKFSSGTYGLFVDVPCFRFRSGLLKFGTPWSVRERVHEGSASGFLPT